MVLVPVSHYADDHGGHHDEDESDEKRVHHLDPRSNARFRGHAHADCARPNAPDVPYCYAKLSRESAARQLGRAYAANAFVGNFYGPSGARGAALRDHIGHVVVMRTKEKVARVHAGPVVAAMQHRQTIWYGAVVQFVGHAVSADGLPLRIADNPITSRVAALCPRPAIINAVGLKPGKEAGAQ